MTEAEARLALQRIAKAMFAIGAGGVILGAAWRGWSWGLGFAAGWGLSWLSFRWLKQIVEALGQSDRPPRNRVAVLAGLRYLLMGGGAYVILLGSQISLTAVLAGLFVAAAAVVVEIFIQLVYARN
jgi:hypothetical protein